MIVVKLMGGLGNQMFQYAIGRRIAQLRGTSIKVDVSFLNENKLIHTKRKYELDVFSANIPFATQTELNKFTAIQNSKLKKVIQRVLPFTFPYYTMNELSHEYYATILGAPLNTLLVGYWQTEKYFLFIQDIIRKDFTFKKLLEGLNKTLAENMVSGNSVSMHIRRGDYVNHSETNQFHGSCSLEYYSTALELIKTKTNNIHLYVFSDDMAWVKANMKLDVPVTYVENNTGDNSYVDMQLMSLCKHNIIANSSFSWWGAWLNINPDKIVVAPTKWFSDSSINQNDIIPEGWHKL